jgi:hypothetical protein
VLCFFFFLCALSVATARAAMPCRLGKSQADKGVIFMAKFPYTIKIVDLNNQFDDEIVQNDLHGVGQILGNLHGKFYNHYGRNYMRWISVRIVDACGNTEYVYNLVDYASKCYAEYYKKS